MSRRRSRESHAFDARGFGSFPQSADMTHTRGERKIAEEIKAEARAYEGVYPFMVEMRQRAKEPRWLPTASQARAIRRCLKVEGSRQPTR